MRVLLAGWVERNSGGDPPPASGGASAVRLMPKTSGVAVFARIEAIYKDGKFSDHAPIIIEFDRQR